MRARFNKLGVGLNYQWTSGLCASNLFSFYHAGTFDPDAVKWYPTIPRGSGLTILNRNGVSGTLVQDGKGIATGEDWVNGSGYGTTPTLYTSNYGNPCTASKKVTVEVVFKTRTLATQVLVSNDNGYCAVPHLFLENNGAVKVSSAYADGSYAVGNYQPGKVHVLSATFDYTNYSYANKIGADIAGYFDLNQFEFNPTPNIYASNGFGMYRPVLIFGIPYGWVLKGTIYAVRIYSGILSDEDMIRNQRIYMSKFA